jgi:capsular exopolysaccharide synthesis family protein
MTFSDFIVIVRRSALLIIVIALTGLGAGLSASLLQPALYTASTEIYVSVRSADSTTSSDIAQGSTAAEQKIRTYVEVATSARVLAPVIDELHLSTSIQDLADSIQVTAGSDTTLLDVSATDHEPSKAARVANAVGASLARVVTDELEKAPDSSSPVMLQTIQEATAPTSPSSPRTALNTALGTLIGLLVGLGVATARSVLDTKVRDSDDVAEATGFAVLGASTFDPKSRRRPLIVHSNPHDPRAEAFRSLRTNLSFADVETRSRSITVTSSLPGEGKTTVASNLALTLAESGAKVVVVDGDLRRPRLAERMGLDGAIGLTDVLIGRLELDEVLQPWGDQKLTILPSGSVPPNPSELLGSTAMKTLVSHLTAEFDFVIIDAPPLLPVTDAAVLTRLTDGALVVVASGRTRAFEVQAAAEKIGRIEGRVIGAVLTMVPAKTDSRYSSLYYSDEHRPAKRLRIGHRAKAQAAE